MRRVVSLFAGLAATASLCFAAGGDISSTQARALIAKNNKVVLLDVRTPEEYRQANLRGSLLIPLSDLSRRINEIPRDRPVLVFCAVGSRSGSAAGLLASRGYREVYNMSDGLVGWYRNGFPLQRGSSN